MLADPVVSVGTMLMRNGPRFLRRTAAAAVLLLVAAGCAEVTPYAPAVDGKGYADQRIESDRYQVSFKGNSVTPRDTVENYLLYRAAEVTLASGHGYFRVIDHETDRQTAYLWTTTAAVPGYYPYSYGGYGAFASFGSGSARPVTSFEAYAQIIVLDRPGRDRDDKVFDAQDVVRNLGPTIVRPKAEMKG